MRYAVLLTLVIQFAASGQALRDINYNYLYEPDEPFSLTLKAIRTTSGWTAYYHFKLNDSTQRLDQYVFQWEMRTSLEERQGTALPQGTMTKVMSQSDINGQGTIVTSSSAQYLTVRVLNNIAKRVWYFYKPLDPKSPIDGYFFTGGTLSQHPYVRINTPITIHMPVEAGVVSYYDDDFPAAVPPFSEGMGRVARSMKVDSSYQFLTGKEISFTDKGLYLVQKDTSSTEGFAFRVEEDYPRLSKIESLADPLIYVCTKQEFDRLKEAKGDKKAFDRVILNITGNQGRARDFIRNYYKRVEWANTYFTSYKEGWKTDRGMIYILFGLPDELLRFSDRELWSYDNSGVKVAFTFVKSSTLFDPENFVLIRDKKFQERWYEKIDLWRSARF